MADLPVEPDVPPAVTRLAQGGIRVLALTNGNGATTKQLLRVAGLESRFEHVISIDDVRQWKPHPAVYRHAAGVAQVEPSRMALIASHAWDTHGAKRAGLVTAWFPRREALYHAALEPPDVLGDSLLVVCEQLVNLPHS
jgi:2-haloacid dehalogenase